MLNVESGLYTCPHHWLENSINIALVGVGATGSAIATLLYKLNHIRRETTDGMYGVKIYLFDPKSVSRTGINRTGFLSTEVGLNKAECIANKLNTAYGKIIAKGIPRPFTKDDASFGYDVVITATDSAGSRYDVGRFNQNPNLNYRDKAKKRLWLDVGVGEQYGNVILGEFGKGKHRLPNVNDLFPSIKETSDDASLKRASCDVLDAISRQSFTVNETGAATAIAILSKLMINGNISVNGAMYEVETCGSSPIRINRQVWRSFGYQYRKNKHLTTSV